MDIKQRVGKRIQELRIKHRLKQAELAEMVNIASKTQSCIERGKNFPSSGLIERYCLAFNMDASDLLNIEIKEDSEQLILNINNMLQRANSKELELIYKLIKSVLI